MAWFTVIICTFNFITVSALFATNGKFRCLHKFMLTIVLFKLNI